MSAWKGRDPDVSDKPFFQAYFSHTPDKRLFCTKRRQAYLTRGARITLRIGGGQD